MNGPIGPARCQVQRKAVNRADSSFTGNHGCAPAAVRGLAACGGARRPAGPHLTRGGSRGSWNPSGSGQRHGTSPPTPAVTGEQSAHAGMGWAPRIRSSRLNAVNVSSSSSSGGGSGGGRSYQSAATGVLVGAGPRCAEPVGRPPVRSGDASLAGGWFRRRRAARPTR
jgi:hypothetical protein